MFLVGARRFVVGGLLLFVAASGVSAGTIGVSRPTFPGTIASSEAGRTADWVVGSDDNGDLPFMIVDKVNARLFLFDPRGTIVATTPVLLGLARGDDSPPGIGERALASITPAERITPAGRFVLEAGENMAGKDIIWVDYDAAISLHRASDRKPAMSAKSRVERLASTSVAERRVSLGCINVSTSFYDKFIQPMFSGTKGVAYILPETRSAGTQFKIPEQLAAGAKSAAT
jgi:hypothetical protein